jgi:hypothetical protein
MALIVEYHVVADMYPVNTANSISAGMAISLSAAGVAIPSPTGNALSIGIAGDSSLNAEGQTTAYSAQLVIGADGAGTRWTENRVSDFYDETMASQKITVYNGGGKFWISEDLFDAPNGIAVSDLLQVSGSAAGEYVSGAAAGTDTIAMAVGSNTAYDSGVPGTATVDGSMSLGNYIPVILRV